MTVAYVDMVSAGVPSRNPRSPDTALHTIRVAIAVESDDMQITQTLVQLVVPPSDWRLDPDWCRRYGAINTATDLSGGGLTVRTLAEQARNALAGVEFGVAHNAPFHADATEALLRDGEIVPDATPPEWFCTMLRSADACRLPRSQGRGFKSPNLAEAYRHFTGTLLRPLDGMDWRSAAYRTLSAVRTVYWGLHRRGIPAPLLP